MATWPELIVIYKETIDDMESDIALLGGVAWRNMDGAPEETQMKLAGKVRLIAKYKELLAQAVEKSGAARS
jgi:hypothetical protein